MARQVATTLAALLVTVFIILPTARGGEDPGPTEPEPEAPAVALVAPGQLSAARPALHWYALDREELRWRSGLWTMPSVRREKERAARAREWALLLTSNIAAGYDSNVFERTAGEDGSGLVDAGLRAELRRYFTERDRLRLWGLVTANPYTIDSEPNAFTQRLGGEYRRRFSQRLVHHVVLEAKHENDNVVNTEGEDPLRDFEHFQYELAPSFRFRISDRQTLWGYYHVRGRDYREQAGLDSLDWWWHGPSLRWRRTLGRRSDLEVDYAFRAQSYEEERAELADGTTLPGNPEEEHHFHRFEIEGFWRPYSRMELVLGYEFHTKDDRFQDFESWDNHRVGAEVTWLVRRLTWRLAAAYEQRDYDRRLGDASALLEYDRIRGEASVGYAVAPNITVYLALTSTSRDTNRSTGSEFRDYDIHRAMAGIAVTY